jgi:hypothetical protein
MPFVTRATSVGAMLLIATVVAAWSRQAAPALADRVASSIKTAEAEGAAFPRMKDDDTPRLCMIVRPDQIVFPTTKGNPAAYVLRSGDFTSVSISFGWDRAYEIAKLPMRPSYPDSIGSGLRVRVTRIDPPGDTLVTDVPSLDDKRIFFPTFVTFPTPGKWIIVAWAGVNWGCYVIDRPIP